MPTYFTSEAEIVEVMGEAGIAMRMDDVDPEDYDTTLNRIMADATDTVKLYLSGRYSVADLDASDFIHRRCTFIACYYISRRRGNPGQFREMYEEARGDLEEIRDGDLILPDTPVSSDMTPALSNFTMDARFRQPMRVRTELSTGNTAGADFIAWNFPFEWV